MDWESLTRSQREAYFAATSGTHSRHVELVVLRKDGTVVRSLTHAFMGGSVTGDVSRTPVEVCEVDVFDPDGDLDWSHGRHRRFVLQVLDHRYVPALGGWVQAHAFTGPMWDYSREGDVVHLVAHGSELHAMGSVRQPFSAPRKRKATTVIRSLLEASGAAKRDLLIPALADTLPERVTVGVRRGKRRDTNGKKAGLGKDTRKRGRVFRLDREDTYWGAAERIAGAIDRELFCDGLGRFVQRAPMSRPVFVFQESHLVEPVVERRGDEGERTNTWHVYGANPKGPKKRIHVKVALPKAHPLSAQSLGRGGQPREIIATIENKHFRTKKAARAAGVRARDRAMRELVEYEVAVLPVLPWLRPNSLVSIPTESGRTLMRVKSWTLPLGPGPDPLTIGATRRRGFRR